jgi:hypothetical protein
MQLGSRLEESTGELSSQVVEMQILDAGLLHGQAVSTHEIL